ncbi:SnoaL-like polyketide cyclase [Dactylosporangium sucinum]|uniref:SnoaL-like polyketide cyclase n=1 Tax=Dactylosporangium sucinum TaxID=1424081 RepID=UPI00167C8A7B|nr:SnoaL-like polyketide cyclase [Dactylosporangium sucinum]
MTETPLWLQGRTAVVEATEPAHWRDGVPDYHLSHTVMPGQRTHQFAPDSLEAVVEKIVQVFEMEVSHKKDPQTWVSMVTEHFRTNVNGGPWASAQDIADTGSYNILIGNSAFYRSGKESFESSHHIFHKAFPGGFYWEVLEVLSPPPVVTFKWRHWGAFEGEYHGFQPDGSTIEMFGVSIAKVDDDLKLLQVEHFYDPNEFLGKLTGGCPVAH